MAMKLLFLDLDGTVLNDEKQIPSENRKAIEMAIAAGHKVFICTGRPLSSVVKLLPEFGLDKPGCYAITYNGGLIYDVGKKEAVYQKTIPLDMVDHVFKQADLYGGIHVQTYTKDAFICEHDTAESLFYQKKTGCDRRVVQDVFAELKGEEPCKVLTIAHGFDRKHLEGFREAMMPWVQGKLDVYFSCKEYLEFMPLGVDKGHAVRWMAEYFDVSMEDTIAVGDEENDLPMIKAAGVGAVMKNASDKMKEYGDYITERDNNEGGVAEVIQKYMLE